MVWAGAGVDVVAVGGRVLDCWVGVTTGGFFVVVAVVVTVVVVVAVGAVVVAWMVVVVVDVDGEPALVLVESSPRNPPIRASAPQAATITPAHPPATAQLFIAP